MKLILLLGTLLLLNGCALMGVYGPEAEERARQRLQQAGEQMRQAGEQMRDGFSQLGNSLDQVTNTAARAAGAYAQGYSQAYQTYEPPPQNQWHTGIIMPPPGGGMNGYYNIGPNGGTITLPSGPPSPNGPSLLDRQMTIMGN